MSTRSRCHRRRAPTLVAMALAVGLATPAASAERSASHAAARVVVTGLAGTLQITGEARSDVHVRLDGDQASLDQVTLELRGDTLHLDASRAAAGGVDVVTSGSNLVIARNGGRAVSRIGTVTGGVIGSGQIVIGTGGSSTVVAGADDLVVELRVPTGTSLDIQALSGEAELAGVDGPVELELLAGEARIDRLTGGRLAITGGGQIGLAEATGDLDLAIAGSGDIGVEHASLDRLEIDLTGAGSVVVGGRAASASVRLAGMGEVRIDQVDARPEVAVAGLGRVAIGNW